MNKLLKGFLFIYLAIVIQIGVFNNIPINYHIVNFLLMYVVYLSQKEGKYSGVFIAFVFGIIYDILISNSIGIRTLSYITVAFIISIFSEYLFLENSFVLALFSVISTIIYKAIIITVNFFQSYDLTMEIIVKRIFNLEILLNVVIIIIIYYIEKKLKLHKLFDFRKVDLIEQR